MDTNMMSMLSVSACNYGSGFVDEKVDEDLNVPIEEDKPLDQIRQTPLNLPDAFEWDTLDITNASIVSCSVFCLFLDLDYCDHHNLVSLRYFTISFCCTTIAI